jgi:putative zinc finger protein
MTAHEPETEGLTCREVVGLFADYLESALGQELIGELEKHLVGCEPCRAYLNTYQRTKTLTAKTERVAMPDEMKNRLRQFLLRALSGGQ